MDLDSDGHGSLTAVPLGRVSKSTVPVVREMRAIHVGPTGVEHSHGGCRSGYRARAAEALGHGAMTPPVGVPTAHQSQHWCQRPSVECLRALVFASLICPIRAIRSPPDGALTACGRGRLRGSTQRRITSIAARQADDATAVFSGFRPIAKPQCVAPFHQAARAQAFSSCAR